MNDINPAGAIAGARRLIALLDDLDVGGHLLNVGVALVAALDLEHDKLGGNRTDGGKSWATIPGIARAVVEPRLRGRGDLEDFRVRSAIRDDRRRYEVPELGMYARCEAPMIRRAGYCGQTSGGGYFRLTDWTTGEQRDLSYCSRHRDWAYRVYADNRRAAPRPDVLGGGAPEPYANAGGHLAAHFPEINWRKLWESLYPGWIPPPERTQPPRPRFELLLGDDDANDSAAPSGGLVLVPSGREITP